MTQQSEVKCQISSGAFRRSFGNHFDHIAVLMSFAYSQYETACSTG